MATGNILAEGNVDKAKLIGPISYNPASLGAQTSREDQIVVSGIMPGDLIFGVKITHDAGFVMCTCRAGTSPDRIAMTFANVTAAPIDPGNQSFYFLVVRPDAGLTAF